MTLLRHIPATSIILSALLLPVSQAMAQSSPPQNGGNGHTCNPGLAALGGAAIGALLGGRAHLGKGVAIGAAAGAAACVAVNFSTRQVKTAQQANQDFQNQHNGQLPAHAELVNFSTQFSPTDKVPAGGSADLVSDIEVAAGGDGVAPKVEEEMTIYDPSGNQLSTVRKTAAGAAGAYETQFSVQMPAGVPQGVYRCSTKIYVNGQASQGTDTQLQVV